MVRPELLTRGLSRCAGINNVTRCTHLTRRSAPSAWNLRVVPAISSSPQMGAARSVLCTLHAATFGLRPIRPAPCAGGRSGRSRASRLSPCRSRDRCLRHSKRGSWAAPSTTSSMRMRPPWTQVSRPRRSPQCSPRLQSRSPQRIRPRTRRRRPRAPSWRCRQRRTLRARTSGVVRSLSPTLLGPQRPSTALRPPDALRRSRGRAPPVAAHRQVATATAPPSRSDSFASITLLARQANARLPPSGSARALPAGLRAPATLAAP